MEDRTVAAPETSTTRTLAAPGCVLTYEIRGTASGTGPPLLIVGSPMGASGFRALANQFADRMVVTYDPRGAERSRRTDGALATTIDEHVDDLHRLIATLGDGPVDVFASSGGAVNGLALVARHPGDVRVLVAHEPPAFQVLPDHEQAVAACVDMHETYVRRGFGPAMARFIALVSFEGPLPPDYLARPEPDPTRFGLPAQDDGSRDDPLLGLNMIAVSEFRPDFDALRSARTRVVIGVGVDSGNAVAGRAGRAVAQGLGIEPVTFPGGHDGFAGSEYGRTGDPVAFAEVLRGIIDRPA